MRRTQPVGPLLALLVVASPFGQELVAAAAAALGSIRVLTGQDLANALANEAVTTALIGGPIVLEDASWSHLEAALPVVCRRNFTIARDPALQVPPFITMRLTTGKVRLADSAVLTVRGVAVDQGTWRRDLGALSPSLGLLTPSLPNETALLVLADVFMTQSVCMPRAVQVASLTALARPAAFPGSQDVGPVLPQEGCTNDTSASQFERCWPRRGRYQDLVLAGLDTNEAGQVQWANYFLHVLRVEFICRAVASDECVQSLGTTGCFLYLITRMPADLEASASPSPPRSTQPDPPPSPPPSPLPSPLPSAPLGEGAIPPGGGGGQQHPGGGGDTALTAALAGALGGTAAVAAAAAAAWWLRRRRRRATPSDGKQASGGAASPPLTSMVLGPAQPARGGGPRGLAPSRKPSLESQPSGAAATAAPKGVSLGSLGRTDTSEQSQFAGAPAPAPPAEPPIVVTPFTPHRADLNLDMRCEAELVLLPVVRGQGNFGRVVEGLYGGQRVAVKLVPDVSGWSGVPRNALRSFVQEIEVLGRCDHPNVVRLMAACVTPPRLCLVMELMECSLERLVHGGLEPGLGADTAAAALLPAPGSAQERGGSSSPARADGAEPAGPGGGGGGGEGGCLLPLPQVLHIGAEVARGLAYLHPTIVHRDLKPGNILLNDPHGPRPVVKLADFGLSRLRSTVQVTQHPEAGTPSYIAPELYDINNAVVSDKCDIYSLGVVLWEMLSGLVPWAGCDPLVVAYAITINRTRLPMAAIPPGRCPPKLAKVIAQCWEHDPLRRPSAFEVAKQLALVAEDLARQGAAAAAAAAAATVWAGEDGGLAVHGSAGGGGGGGAVDVPPAASLR